MQEMNAKWVKVWSPQRFLALLGVLRGEFGLL
jgi:hypothetical protein